MNCCHYADRECLGCRCERQRALIGLLLEAVTATRDNAAHATGCAWRLREHGGDANTPEALATCDCFRHVVLSALSEARL